MNRNIKILDCTLRDGGRIIDCKFPDKDIIDIATRLAESGIDIIEMGFLRDWRKLEYKGNSTFFTSVEQIIPFIPKDRKASVFVAFVDFGMFDFDNLSSHDGKSIDGIRVGFTKKDFDNHREEIIRCLNIVKEKGYMLFVQGVNSLGYTDAELLRLIQMINEVHPYAFGIVDTYGAMYVDDVRRVYGLIDHNMLDDIVIDFHSHNNFQLSFAFAQEIIELAKGVRNIIIDCTLNGMGKCAGNLNTELIVDYLVRKRGYNYDFDSILDIIDEYMYSIKEHCSWGYSIPSMMAGIYQSHPNNVIYLTEKFRLATKDIKYIISMIDPSLRQRYDYDNIQRLYREYNHTKVNDKEAIEKLHSLLRNRDLLVLSPGKTLLTYRKEIEKYILENNPFVISVNFISDFTSTDNRLTFYGSSKRYKRADAKENEKYIVVVSNVENYSNDDIVINYESLIERNNDDCDNTMIMLLNLLKRLDISSFAIAGFDGYVKGRENYFNNSQFQGNRFEEKYDSITENMRKMLKNYAFHLSDKNNIKFITPSAYEDIFKQ